jgi:hypothetical protein
MRLKSERRVWIVENLNGTYYVVGKRKLNEKKKCVKFRRKTLVVNIDAPIMVNKTKDGRSFLTYFVDTENNQLSVFPNQIVTDPSYVDVILSQEVVRQAVNSLGSAFPALNQIVMYVLLFAVGLMIGVVAGPSITGGI